MHSHAGSALEYHRRRLTKRSLRYRLERRTAEVSEAIRKYAMSPRHLLDIGTADGLMAETLTKQFHLQRCTGIDHSRELLTANPARTFFPILADAASLPFQSETYDVVTAAAVVEHIEDLDGFLSECHRVLKEDGILVFTTSQPFYVRIYTWLDAYERETSHELLNLSRMVQLSKQARFELLATKRYMMSPIGFPWERAIEKAITRLGLGILLISQLAVVRKHGA